jgi:glutathione peroxidase-family protein
MLLAASAEATDLSQSAAPAQLLLIVNVASQCGFTPQYAGLEALHRRFRARGFCSAFRATSSATRSQSTLPKSEQTVRNRHDASTVITRSDRIGVLSA